MIVVDTSALVAIALDEPIADQCQAALDAEIEVSISAGTLAEALIVAEMRGVRAGMNKLIEGLDLEVLVVTKSAAERVAEAYRRWGKGAHPASLNLGDCYAYEAAERQNCRLLFVGNDFSKTDLVSVL